jgi:hypothetical protein
MDELTPDPIALLKGALTKGRTFGAVSKGDFFSSPPIPKVDGMLDAGAGNTVDVGSGVGDNEEAMFPKPNDEAACEDDDVAGPVLSSNGFFVLYFFASLSNNCRSRPL